MIDDRMDKKHWWNYAEKGQPEYLQVTYHNITSCTTNSTETGLRSKQSSSGERPAWAILTCKLFRIFRLQAKLSVERDIDNK